MENNPNHPKNKDEYLERFHTNQRVSGFGFGNVHIHMPCPFCAAPDFLVYEIMQTEEALKKDTACAECGRSSKSIFKRNASGVEFELVQTGGDDSSEWLTPKMRRV